MGDPLQGWDKTTIWYRVGLKTPGEWGEAVEFDVWHPPDCSEAEVTRLIEKHSAQGATLIRQLMKTKEVMIQGSRTYHYFDADGKCRCPHPEKHKEVAGV